MEITMKHLSPYVRPNVYTAGNGCVKMYGDMAVCMNPPDITGEHKMQTGNDRKIEKIKLKTSSEIKNNYIGCCTTRMPRIPENDYNPLKAVNLIDGCDKTCYSSHLRIRSDEYPVVIRIDLAKETVLSKVVIKKRPITFDRRQYKGPYLPSANAQEVGRAMAKKIEVKVSCDAYEWKTLFDGEVDSENLEEFEFDMKHSPCKQLLISANDLTECENWGYSFSVASIEAYDDNGINAALIQKGACVTVNSQHSLSANERGAAMYNWQLHMDLGFKWSRIGYHDDPINWHWTETQKGVLKMDAMAEDAIDMLCENGIKIVYCLNFGNRLYEGYKERKLPQLKEWYYESPRPPKSEEALKAWDEFVKFSVEYFKDRVEYFEIWNEWNGMGYWGEKPDADMYIKLAKRTIAVIRKIAPGAKIALGSFAQFVHEQRPDNCDENIAMFYKAIKHLAPFVDAIGFHPFYQPTLDSDRYLNYTDNIAYFKKYCEECGFTKNVYMASEFAVGAMYPPVKEGLSCAWWGQRGKINYSEVEKAKIITQLNVIHSALGIESMVCELSNHDYPLELSLLRKGFDSAPIQQTNPNMAYYATRNTCTVLDGYNPGRFDISLSDGEKVKKFAFESDNHYGIAIWTTHTVSDFCEGKSVDITIDRSVSGARAYSLINGTVTEIYTSSDGEKTKLSGIIVRDCPIFIELDKNGGR